MKTLRVIGQTRYEDRGYSNEESIAYLQLQKPEEITSLHPANRRLPAPVGGPVPPVQDASSPPRAPLKFSYQ